MFVFVLSSAVFVGCAPLKAKEASPTKLTYHDGKTRENISWPGDGLREEFERYWSSRFSGLWKETWAMEAPYFVEMTTEKKYENFIKAHIASHLSRIEIWSIEKQTNELLTIRCEISYEKAGEAKTFFTKDTWVKVRDKWYHVIHDPILFPSSL